MQPPLTVAKRQTAEPHVRSLDARPSSHGRRHLPIIDPLGRSVRDGLEGTADLQSAETATEGHRPFESLPSPKSNLAILTLVRTRASRCVQRDLPVRAPSMSVQIRTALERAPARSKNRIDPTGSKTPSYHRLDAKYRGASCSLLVPDAARARTIAIAVAVPSPARGGTHVRNRYTTTRARFRRVRQSAWRTAQ